MAWTLVDSDVFSFSDGNGGHVVDFGSAPNVGEWDAIFLNSNTVLAATPSGWTRTLDLIAGFGAGNQGAYALTRKATGGESSTVTIQTSGNFNATASWSRWAGGDALDVATAAVIDASAGSTTPTVSTGTLADPDELVLACAALQGAFPTVTPTWTAGYTPLTAAQYNGGPADEVSAYVAYRTDGGTAAEAPQADWTSDPAAPVPDRYVMVLTFTPAPTVTPATVTPASVDAVAAVPAPSVSAGATVAPSPIVALAAVPGPAVSTQSQATVTPPAVACTTTIPTPGVSAGATATPGTVAAVGDLPPPVVTALTAATVTPTAVAAVASLPPPLLSQSATATPATVAAVATLPPPIAGPVLGFGGWGTLTPGVVATSTLTATSAATSTLLATVSP